MLQLVTDSTSDLPPELIEKYQVHVVPLTVIIDEHEYTEGVDITLQEFLQGMQAAKELPKTSQPSSFRFAQLFKDLSSRGQVLCLTMSSKLSGTYQSACIAKSMCGANVTVFDTLAGTLGLGLQVIKAAELSIQGLSLEEIVEHLQAYRDKMNIFILLNTLENVVKGGRLSKFQGTLTKILNIKILLQNIQGSVEMLEQMRGKNKALQRLLDHIEERRQGLTDFPDRIFGITHVNNIQDAEFLKNAIIERFHPKDVIINNMSATFSTYAGMGGLIVSF